MIRLGAFALAVVVAAGIMSLVFGFSLTHGLPAHNPPVNVVHVTVTTYPVPPMPTASARPAHGSAAHSTGHVRIRRVVRIVTHPLG